MAAPLTNLVGEAPWTWSAAQDLAFEETQRAIDQARQLTIRQEELAPRESEPIHFGHPPTTAVRNPVSGKYIFLQCDASTVGTSACVMYGENWWNAQPVYHHSRKLTGAQLNYPVHEIELLAIYEGFQKYRNILFGRRVIVLTNNNSLTSFLTAKEVNDRQARAYAFMSRFAFSIRHIDGECNHVPDMLSRQYENDNLAEGYVEDGRLDDLDTERDDGPLLFDRSLGAMTASTKAKGKGKAPDRPGAKAKTTRRPSGKRAAKAKAARLKEEATVTTHSSKIVSQIEDFDRYKLIDDVLWQKDEVFGDRMCVASGKVDRRTAREVVLEHVHEMTGHEASRRMTDHAQHHFWWQSLSSDIDKYC
ncbi:BQ5605_C001g00923 [Microbotryum silenes-dioicae]|uniref:BQ5605_C001g00923 protein n=1 Tax=Microbotryum silenes-dioicae TaxID=796604 RepID=A0A2X0M4S2_9BASI|nr:BQ5605_C001g00923 [Microbotryum silenes-dioicae]